MSVDLPEPETPVTQVKAPDGEADVDAAQVVHARAAHGEPLAGQAALAGHLDAPPAREELAGQRAGRLHDLGRRALGDDLAAVLAGPGAHVDEVVGRAHRLFVVLDDDHRVAEVAQAQQGVDEAPVVALVQADRGLVEDVEHADERRADLRGQADALRLAAGERRGRALQVEVADADVVEEAEALADLLDHAAADEALGVGQREAAEELHRRAHAHRREVVDVDLADGDREAARLEPRPVALGADPVAHVLLDLLAHELGLGLLVAPLQVPHEPGEGGGVVPHAAFVVAVAQGDAAVAGAVEEETALLLGQFGPRRLGIDVEGLRDRLDDLLDPAVRHLPVREQRPLGDGDALVGHDEARVDLARRAEAVAGRAGAVRAVEAEHAGLDLGQRDAAVHAGELLAEGERRAVDDLDLDETLGELRRRLDGVGEAAAQPVLHHEAVDHDGDVVLVLLVEVDRLLELAHLTVDLDAREAVGAQLVEEAAVLALAPAHERRDHAEARALLELADLVDDLLHRLPGDRPPALRAVRVPDARVEQAQVVVDLGDRADRRARVARGRLLVDRDRRREPLDGVDVGLVHLPEELPRVGRERLDVAALTLGVDRVEGERRLARAREPGDDDEAVARQAQGDVLEVVLAGAGDDETVAHCVCRSLVGRARPSLRPARGASVLR